MGRKNSNTEADCKAKASYLSTLKNNKDETFHIIKSSKDFIVSNDPLKQAEFRSLGAYWIVRKAYYNGMQGDIITSYRNGKEIKRNPHKPNSGGIQTKAEFQEG